MKDPGVASVAVTIRFAGKLRRLASVDRKQIKTEILGLVGRRKRMLRAGALNLNLVQNGQKFRQLPLFLCKAKFWGSGKSVVATGEEYGIWQTVDQALDKIEHKLIQYKERGLRYS